MKSNEEVRRENLQKVIRERYENSQTAASDKLGYDRPTLVNHWIAGRKAISTASARKIEKAFGLPDFWMDSDHSSGKFDPPNIGRNHGIIKEALNSPGDTLDKHERKKFDKNVDPAPLGKREVPVISYIQAGMMTEVVDPYALGDGFEKIMTDADVSEGAFALVIKGLSMEPEFREGDKVIIDPAVAPLPGDFVAAKNGHEEATFKKYRPRGSNEHGDQVFELVPLNEDFATLQSERDKMHIIGTMVEHRKYRRR